MKNDTSKLHNVYHFTDRGAHAVVYIFKTDVCSGFFSSIKAYDSDGNTRYVGLSGMKPNEAFNKAARVLDNIKQVERRQACQH